MVVEEVCQLLEADRGTLFLMDENRGQLWSKVALKSEIAEIVVPIGKGIAGYVAQTGEVVNIPDAYQDPRFNPEVDRQTGYRTRAILCIPLKKPSLQEENNEKIIGVLQLLNKKTGPKFTPDDEQLLQSVGGSLAILLENANLYHQLQAQYSQLEYLYEGEKVIAGGTTLEGIFHQLLDLYNRKFDLEASGILLKENQGFRAFWKYGKDEQIPLITQQFLILPTYLPFGLNEIRSTDLEQFGELMRFLGDLSISRKSVLMAPIGEEDSQSAVLFMFGAPDEFRKYQIFIQLVQQQVRRALELHQSRMALLESERLSSLGTMMSAVVHDLRLPLNNILGYVELLADEDTTPEERMEYKEIIDREIKSMVRMSNEILDYAKGKRTVFLRKVGIRELCEEFISKIQLSFAENQINFITEEIPTGVIRADREKLLRAFINIARNAIEALAATAKQGKEFRFTVEKDEHEYLFRFRDNGPGIPDEIVTKLFTRFASAGKKGGTGLGLVNVKQIVEEHGGRIDFLTQKNVGTEFIIYIPEYTK